MRHIHTRLGIIAIAALLTLSAFSVMAAPRSAAAPSVPDSYTIMIGKSKTWGGQQFNVHYTSGNIVRETYTESAVSAENKIVTSMTWTTSSDVWRSPWAYVGVKVRLPGTYTLDQFHKIQNTPVTVKVTVPYSLAASTDGLSYIAVGTGGPYSTYTKLKQITGGSASGVATGEVKLHLYNVVRSSWPQESGVCEGTIYVAVSSAPFPFTAPSGSASAHATVANIKLTWPDGASAS